MRSNKATCTFLLTTLVVVLLSKLDSAHAYCNNVMPQATRLYTSTFPLFSMPPSTDEAAESKPSTARIPDRKELSEGRDPAFLSQETAGGFTVKQRLREEVESPFRKVRLVFFGSSAGSALTALYFSMLNTIKAYQGGWADAPPLDEALTSDAINIGAAIICGLLALRDYRIGEANLERIAQGGRLAALPLEIASNGVRRQVKDYRRFARVVLTVGGPSYLDQVARSLTADQLQDTNTFPEKLQATDILVVPVLLTTPTTVSSDTKTYWSAIGPESSDKDRNMDLARAEDILAYPLGQKYWEEYLGPELKTANSQGFDVMEKGVNIMVKKNGRILRRATGLPPWGDMIATMEVADGSQFGMPGDSEKYGGN